MPKYRRVNLNGNQGHAVFGTSTKSEPKIGAVAATARACSRRTGGGRNLFMFSPMIPSQSQDDENEPDQEEAKEPDQEEAKEPEPEPELDLNYVDKAAPDRIVDYEINVIALVNFDNLIGEIIKSVVSTIDINDNRTMAQELENNWYLSIDDTLYKPTSYDQYNDGTSTYIYLSTTPEYTPGEDRTGENDYEIKFYTTRNLTDEPAPAPEPEDPFLSATSLGATYHVGDNLIFHTLGSGFDTELGIYDANGNLVASNDDDSGGQSGESKIVYTFNNVGKYYLVIGGYDIIFSNHNFGITIGHTTIIGDGTLSFGKNEEQLTSKNFTINSNHTYEKYKVHTFDIILTND